MIRAFAAAVVLVAVASQTPQVQRSVIVVFDTEKGTIETEVDGVHAPATAANFLKYVDAGFGSSGPYGTESLMPPIRILKAYRKER